MLRNKLVNLFGSHQKLIHEAEVLCQLLRSYCVAAADVPRTLLQLGAKYKTILKHDRDVLQKQIPIIKDDAVREQSRQVLTAINKLLNYKHLNSADAAVLENNSLPEAQHFNDTVRFMAERDLYAAEVRLYLQEIKEDIATVKWERANGMPRAVADINCALDDSEMKRDESSVGVLAKYEEVKRHIARLGNEPNLHPEASVFYRYHQDQIDSLSFVPLKEKSRVHTLSV